LGGGVGLLHPCDRVEDRFPDIRRAHIAREHAVAGTEHAALVDPLHDLADQVGLEHAPAKRAIAGMVRELHGVDRPHLDA
jgi:hypothetical protein